MQNTNLSRRALFGNLFSQLTGNAQKKDPLFEKYSRKVFNGRKSSSLLYKARKSELNRGNEALERVQPVTSGLAPYTGLWTTREALHLLRRTGFGVQKSQLDSIVALPFNTAINTVLNVNTYAPGPINHYETYKGHQDVTGVPYGGDWTNTAHPEHWDENINYGGINRRRMEGLQAWQIELALDQDITIREKMVLFWYHFIPVNFERITDLGDLYVSTNSARICYRYMKMFRDNSVGNFKTLISSMARQSAMAYYLNNVVNTKTAPDENFAREIMELFTLGKDSPDRYTQADVVQAAKLLTGWRVLNLNTVNESVEFVAEEHDFSPKQFSSFFNNRVIQGTGAGELDEFIDMIFQKQVIVSQYICRRLYRFFVYYDIDATTETNIIVPLAQLFVSSNWEILPVLEKLFKSQHFFDIANRGVYIKTPFDLLLGTIKSFNINYKIPNSDLYGSQYAVYLFLNEQCDMMNQGMGNVKNVAGWTAFYQKPNFYQNWINSDSIQRRFKLINGLFEGLENTNYYFDDASGNPTVLFKVDGIAFVQQFSDDICIDPNQLVSECIKYLLPVDLAPEQKSIIKTQTLLSNLTSDYYWSDAWEAYKSNPADEMAKSTVQTRLKGLLNTIVQYAEYQLM
jgi:uncharacterized protein (DUF1800 family)